MQLLCVLIPSDMPVLVLAVECFGGVYHLVIIPLMMPMSSHAVQFTR